MLVQGHGKPARDSHTLLIYHCGAAQRVKHLSITIQLLCNTKSFTTFAEKAKFESIKMVLVQSGLDFDQDKERTSEQ